MGIHRKNGRGGEGGGGATLRKPEAHMMVRKNTHNLKQEHPTTSNA